VSLTVRCGWLWVLSVVLPIPSAYFASAASTAEFLSSLLPSYLFYVEDSGTANVLNVDEAGMKSSIINTILQATDSLGQRLLLGASWNGSTDNKVECACLFCLSWWRDWFSQYPATVRHASLSLKMYNLTLRIAVGLRLGIPIVSWHVYVCGMTIAIGGQHGLSCLFGSDRHLWDNQVNDLLCRAFFSTGTLATSKPYSLCTRDNKWLMAWCRCHRIGCHGKKLGALSGMLPVRTHLISLTSMPAVSRWTQWWRLKRRSLANILTLFLAPFAIEPALELLTKICHRISAATHHPRSTMFLCQRLSMAMQWGCLR